MSAAPRPTASPLDRLADALPGWLFAVSGLALIAAVVLTPAWLSLHESQWRLKVMQAQAQALADQRANYEGFARAVADDDPVVLERLAMTQLRLTLEGKLPLRVRSVASETGDVGAWLSVPQPVIGRDVPAYAPPVNRVVRMAAGPGRGALLAVGLLCLIGGLFFNPRSKPKGDPFASRHVTGPGTVGPTPQNPGNLGTPRILGVSGRPRPTAPARLGGGLPHRPRPA